MAGRASGGPVAEFCAELRRLVQGRGLDRAALARQLGYSRSQLYEILDGRISRPPEWDRLVGETLVATRQLEAAFVHHTDALTLATQVGDRYKQARAHNGLAHAHQAGGDLDQARHHWQHALALYTDLGVPDAEDIRHCLAALDHIAGGSDPDRKPSSRGSSPPWCRRVRRYGCPVRT